MLETYEKDVIGEDYRSLIEIASKKCDKFAFVKRKDMMADEKLAMKYFNEFVKDIKNSLIEMKEQSEWEVNKLLEATAYVCYYELNEQTKNFLQTKSNSLFGWIGSLPEDLILYSGDKVWLACNSHESYFFVNKELDNYEDLMKLLKNA
ncbi:hypothetical protein [Psychrobacillus sp. OK032]|uniref:hypothetical protein n=1 Tax=Psychrobacillus sp. OK032 TaxID=1884358 RepID=UPI0008D5CCF4|nr:hypothetical protein [Psychrobacillus sp. OK032]SES44522.1 hypothetical protein SAMN05518872_11432 [Psychrobacillus sp. OK032]